MSGPVCYWRVRAWGGKNGTTHLFNGISIIWGGVVGVFIDLDFNGMSKVRVKMLGSDEVRHIVCYHGFVLVEVPPLLRQDGLTHSGEHESTASPNGQHASLDNKAMPPDKAIALLRILRQ
eukprot:5308399-Amphidinium_carterae.1